MNFDVNELLLRGVAAHKEGNIDEAENIYRTILEIQPTHPDACHNLGTILLSTNKSALALPLLKIAIQINPKIEQFWLTYGNIQIIENKLEDAELSFRKVIELNKDNVIAYYNLAKLLIKIDEIDNTKTLSPLRLLDAVQNYKKTIEIKPYFAEAHINLGNVLVKLGKLDESEICYEKAIKLKPNYFEVYNKLGIVQKELGKLKDAETSYKKAIKIKPDFAVAHNNLGNIFSKLGYLDEAEISYRKALKIEPEFALAYVNLGALLHKIDDLDEAEISYRKALKIEPYLTFAYSGLGAVLHTLNRLDESEESYRMVLKLKPHDVEAKHILTALSEGTSKSAPREYVESLFDKYASHFENSLVNKLEYNIPKKIIKMITTNNSNIQLGSILDLGCGTGLIGDEIKNFCSNLQGIDLSLSMLDQAKNKNIYDKLEQRDITEYLSTENLDFNYFIAADVFVYVGDLSEVFRLIKSRKKSKGKLVFSTEHTDKDGFFLEKSGRYSHSKKYIESLCNEFGYKLSHFETTNLRKEKNEFLTGGLYLLDF